jgi:hypothetical protein
MHRNSPGQLAQSEVEIAFLAAICGGTGFAKVRSSGGTRWLLDAMPCFDSMRCVRMVRAGFVLA